MRNFMKFVALLALVASCQTTAGVIKEPERTEYYGYCLMNGFHATTCQCMEEKTVADTGITGIPNADEATQKKFIEALNSHVEECVKATQKLLDGSEAGK